MYKKIGFLLFGGILVLGFQNFLSRPDGLGNRSVRLEANQLRTQPPLNRTDKVASIKDQRQTRSSGHELKIENDDDFFPEVGRLSRDEVIKFRTELLRGDEKARSEIRVRGVDIKFADKTDDQVYRSSFYIFVPKNLNDNFERSRTVKGDWNIIWQVAQFGSSLHDGYYRNSSPPLSLQLYDNRVYMRTNHDYGLWAQGRRDDAKIFRDWQRLRVGSGGRAEEGEGESVRKDFVYGGYLSPDRWNLVSVEFKMGQHGYYKLWVNGRSTVNKVIPIGYKTADDPNEGSPKFIERGVTHIRKRGSVRFGIYQGFGPWQKYRHQSKRNETYIKDFRLGTRTWDLNL